MTEPTTSGVTLAIGAVTLTGSFLGMDGNHLMAGLFGAFVALRYAGPLSAWGLFSSLATGTLVAGQLAPALAGIAAAQFAWLASLPGHVGALAFVLGICTQTVLPALLKRLDRTVEPTRPQGGEPGK